MSDVLGESDQPIAKSVPPSLSLPLTHHVPNYDAGGQFRRLFCLQKVCEKYPGPMEAQAAPGLESSQICKSGALALLP